LVRRIRGSGEDRAVLWIHGDDRATVGVVGPVGLRGLDPEPERLLCRLLEIDVDRKPNLQAGSGLLLRRQRALRLTERVDRDLGRACFATQVRVECRLDSGLPDLVAR